jgi:hypothetical protein
MVILLEIPAILGVWQVDDILHWELLSRTEIERNNLLVLENIQF